MCFENNKPVLLWELSVLDERQNKVENANIELISVKFGSICIDGCMHIFEMALEDAIGWLFGDVVLESIDVFHAWNDSIFHHIVEAPPNQCPGQRIWNPH